MKIKRKMFKAALLLMCCAMFFQTAAWAAVLPANVDKPSDGCTFIGVSGSYIMDSAAALKRINAIRLEACKEGVINPSTGEPLTVADYTPIKWSYDLEYVARIRAAEAAVYMGHDRTNGESCFSVASPNGVTSSNEVLAWNFSDSVLTGIEQWYGEKKDWVKSTGGVTGHYEALINPTNRHVGLATFYTSGTRFCNTTCGEFSMNTGLSEARMPEAENCMQTIEVQNSALAKAEIVGLPALAPGGKTALTLSQYVTYTAGCETTSQLYALSGISWRSSKPAVATVNASGMVTAFKQGSTKITATANGKSASMTLKVLPSVKGKVKLQMPSTKVEYDESGRFPTVTVMGRDGKLLAWDSYQVEFPSIRKGVGRYTVKVHFIKKYAGTLTKTFTIVPKGSSVKKLTAGKKTITVKWKKRLQQTTGYQIQYAGNKKFKGARKVTVKSNKTVSKKITKLKKKLYYVRVRTYKTVGGKKYYSLWSKAKTVKV